MRRKTIRLTERELTNLIKRMVTEAEDYMSGSHDRDMGDDFMSRSYDRNMSDDFMSTSYDRDMDMGSPDDSSWIMSAARRAAQMFRQDVLSDMSEDEIDELKSALPSNFDPMMSVEKLQRYVSTSRGQEALETAEEATDTLTESYLYESDDKKLSRTMKLLKFFGNLGIFSGIGITAMGIIGFMSQSMGYTDAGYFTSFFMDTHDMIQNEFGCDRFCGPLSVIVAIIGIGMALGGSAMKYNANRR
jgi:hypothetical protein